MTAHALALGDVAACVDDEPVEPRRELRLASELRQPDAELRQRLLRSVTRVLVVAQEVPRQPLDLRRMPLAQHGEGAVVAVFDALHEDGVAEPLVVERPLGPQGLCDSTGLAERRLHGSGLV
jgi:hypothetical protein